MNEARKKNIPDYERFADKKRLEFIKQNLKSRIGKKARVLDVGCGNGIISMQLGALGYNVDGIDVSEKAIQNAKRINPFPNVNFIASNVEAIKLAGTRYDAIICSEVLEHLHKPADLLKQLHTILKDDGVLIATVPNGRGPREVFITKPVQKLVKKDNWLWQFVQKTKRILGYSGTTIQSAADDLTHIQFFSKNDIKKLAFENSYKITKLKSVNFIDDVFPFSLITRHLFFLQKLDSAFADILPIGFSGGFLMVFEKQKTELKNS